MKKTLTQLIWVMILLGPLLVLVVCNRTEQRYDQVPIWGPKYPDPKGGPDSVYKTVGPFKFISQSGDTITTDSLRGKIWVANVFFSRCTGICPKMSANFTILQEYFANVPEVKLVSFSVDPEHDSASVLKEYAAQFGALDHKWYMLTGEKEKMYEVEKNEFFFKAYEGEGGEMGFIHDEGLRLIDKEGRFRGLISYNGTRSTAIDSLKDDIHALLLEYEREKHK